MPIRAPIRALAAVLLYPVQEALVRILVIDDDGAVLDIVSLMLTAGGHAVLPAASGREALARLEAGEAVDLVLTDLNMPDMNGREVVRAIRSRWPSIRVGLLSGSLHHLPEQHEGPDLILRKPVGLAELLAAIDRLRDEPGSVGTG